MAEYLSKAQIEELRRTGDEEDIPFLGRQIKRKIDFRNQNWTTNQECSIPRSPNPIKIALVGLGGAGKSLLGNTLVGEEKFQTGKTATSVTETFQIASFKAHGQDFLVLDTPGYMIEKMESLSPKELIKRSLQILPGFKAIGEGVHAVIFVINSSVARQRGAEIEVMAKSKMLSVKSTSIKYCMLVATHAASNYGNDRVGSFISNANESTEFRAFVEKIDSRVLLIEQQELKEMSFSEKEREASRDMILSMVGKVMQENNNEILKYETIKAEIEPCFPSKAITCTSSGPKSMDELELNDEVLVVNHQGQMKYERVIMFSHAARDEVGCFLSISTDDGKVMRLSPGHLVHVGQVGQLKPARDVKAGDVMFTCGEGKQEAGTVKSVKVTEVSNEWFTAGIFCPHTPSGSIIVDGVLASCYTDLMSPTLAHALMLPVRTLHRVLSEDWFVWLMPYNSEQGMPKVLWSMKNMIPSLRRSLVDLYIKF